jgi:dTDP-4-dehydrorhamnose reductase
MILLIGTGYIGSAFVAEMEARKIEFKTLTHDDVWALEDIMPLPEFVINAAGFSGKPNVDACEDRKDETFTGNVSFPLAVGTICKKRGIPWAHISSGCIYNGPGPYREEDEPNFSFEYQHCSYYAGTKALAEKLVRNLNWRSYLWRLRIPFDEYNHPKNYLTKLLTYPRILECTNSLTHRGDFAKACLDLWQRKAPCGTYNMTNRGAISSRLITEWLGAAGLRDHFSFWPDDNAFRASVKAPRSSCVLSTDKMEAAGVTMRPIEDAVRDAIEKWKA